MTTSVSSSRTGHHGLAAHEVVLLLGTDPHRGLTGREATERLARFGPNTLPAAVGAGLLVRILRQFHHPLIYVLLAAGAITAALGEYAAIVVGAALPVLPTQILWINMTTAVALGLMLAFEPKEAGIMTRPPRDPDRPLLTRALMVRILLVSTLLVAGAWWLFEWELAQGASLAEARTAAMNVFVVVQAFYLFSCRSLTHSVWRIGVFSNRWIIVGVIVQALGQLAIIYIPAMNMVFDTAPIGADVWLRILAIAVVASLVVAVDKRLRRPRA